ncbi:hypothetical protein GOP47_0018968 [Adiantum capillus-veneris]|uniref:RCK N-terminal domain-containing protein n=1 Tax=Adiantum capillus-veneris TaxID=13818 RepID=A0A9D4UFF6_ADICA|nr:hypothetical protein GOP47_0018968 [Adiantum capillus-veneris]
MAVVGDTSIYRSSISSLEAQHISKEGRVVPLSPFLRLSAESWTPPLSRLAIPPSSRLPISPMPCKKVPGVYNSGLFTCAGTLAASALPLNASEGEENSIEHLKGMLQSALEELDLARLNSSKIEEDAQAITERAIALRDKAVAAEARAENAAATVSGLHNEELGLEGHLSKARISLAEAEARLVLAQNALKQAKEAGSSSLPDFAQAELENVVEGASAFVSRDSSAELEALESIGAAGDVSGESENEASTLSKEEEELDAAEAELKAFRLAVTQYETELMRFADSKSELQKEVIELAEAAKVAREIAIKADEEVTRIMSLAEQAVAVEVDAAQRVCIAEIALQKAEKLASEELHIDATEASTQDVESVGNATAVLQGESGVESDKFARDMTDGHEVEALEKVQELEQMKPFSASFDAADIIDDTVKRISAALKVESAFQDPEAEKVKSGQQQKEPVKEATSAGVPKSSTKRSSRFFSASYFSFNDDDKEFTPTTVFQGIRQHFLKVSVGVLLLCGGSLMLKNRMESQPQLAERTEFVSEVTSSATKPLVMELRRLPKRVQRMLEKIPHQEVNEEEASLFDVLWLLLASVIFVPIFQKLPGGSPVLGYLAAGVLIGPYSLSIIRHVHGTKAIAEFGVVFLLFNIGLELSVERLSSMKKYVFGLGTSQVFVTALVVGLVSHFVCGFSGPAALVVGNGLALSSTAVVLQVLQERGESTSRHGRATFSVLLFQDLAVVVLLILLPLISPSSSKGGVGFQAIAEALGVAAVKGVVAIAAIIAGGRLLLRPIYNRMAENHNAEIFAANTLFVVLGTSVLTARAGLSMALGAFLAGLLLAETEFALQVESDIAPYRGLLLGLFFMTVGMSIDPKLFISKFPIIIGALSLLLFGKTFLVVTLGRIFGLSTVAAVRAGLLLAPGGEFAFVAFGEAVNQRIMTPSSSSLLFLVVGLSMALTPWLGALGQFISSRFEQQDLRSLLPAETETDDLQDHIIICGFGRVGQIIAQLLSDRLIPFVALDVRSERVSAGRALDLPVYFGDAGSKEVLHKVGAERAACAVITLDTPGANYRTVWALSKHFPNVKTFVRAHDVEHGINLEKAGATAVVPETLEPSLQLAAAVLAQAKLPASEIAATIDEFRTKHLSELTELSEISGASLGYGFSRNVGKSKVSNEPSGQGIAGNDIAGAFILKFRERLLYQSLEDPLSVQHLLVRKVIGASKAGDNSAPGAFEAHHLGSSTELS